MSLPVNCVNCGRENLVDGVPGEKCLFCGLPVREKVKVEKRKIINKKEVTMQQERAPVPPRPKKRKKLWEYFEQNKKEIIADYQSMILRDFFKRWGITTVTWKKLKDKWKISTKGPGARTVKSLEADSPKVDELALNEHERYLVLLGYQQAVREFIKARHGYRDGLSYR